MAEKTWLLKTGDELFGPETEERLLSWAKAGRIQPGQSISSDGEEWIPVTEVAFLDMRWSIDLKDGKPPRGPFHRDAVDALVARGRLPENIEIIEARDPWPKEEDEIAAETAGDTGEEDAQDETDEAPGPVDEVPAETEEQSGRENAKEEAAEEEKEEAVKNVREETLDASEEKSAAGAQQLELPNMPSDASVLYGLMREEAESLAKLIEAENRETEEFRNASLARRERMQERRQELLRLIGSDADDMVRRARITHPGTTRDAGLRQDYNQLKLLQERTAQEAKNKIDMLSERLEKSELEARRLRQQIVSAATLSKQLADTREMLQRREKEIVAERAIFEEERRRFAAERQTLLARLSSLEVGLAGESDQAREARGVKLAPWMGFKK